MSAVVNSHVCDGCGACVNECPLNAISMNNEGIAEIDGGCIGCKICVEICHQGAITTDD